MQHKTTIIRTVQVVFKYWMNNGISALVCWFLLENESKYITVLACSLDVHEITRCHRLM